MGLLLLSCVALSLLTSCGERDTRPAVYVPEQVLAATGGPSKPQGDYMQDSAAVYVLGQKRALAKCNADKAAVWDIVKPSPQSSKAAP